MDALLLALGGAIVVFVGLAVALSWPPRRRVERRGPDYEAIAEVEAHDIDDMVEGIGERRRRRGARDVGDELADELIRGTWDDARK